MSPAPISDDELRGHCTRFLSGHGPVRPHETLLRLAEEVGADDEPDRYGAGGPVAELEREVADLLGKPAALFLPSGTMAQPIALRVWCDRAREPTVAFHPTCHLELHEFRAYSRLHGLNARLVGDARSLLTLADLEAVPEPLGALVLELPQREIGGRLPEWDDLVAQTAWARERGVAVHLDGARLWECGPYYDRPYAEIAALFDSVYVSFYKGLAGLAGCCLAGPEHLIESARVWRHRQGGTLFALWPYAVAARAGLRDYLPRMPLYVERAGELAGVLAEVPGVEVVPSLPPTPMMHLHLMTTAEQFRDRARGLAERSGVWTWPRAASTDRPTSVRVELSVGESTLGFAPAEVAEVVADLLR